MKKIKSYIDWRNGIIRRNLIIYVLLASPLLVIGIMGNVEIGIISYVFFILGV